MIQLDARRGAVLRAVVEEHIRSAGPVGSEHVAARGRLGVSPATIRSTMAVLEEMGLLTHPHTSAGRVPTDQGYRIYVDMLLEADPLPAAERRAIHHGLESAADEPEDLAGQAARILASLTHYASVVAAPGLRHQTLQSLHLLPVDGERALVVITTSSGMLHGRPIAIPREITGDDLDRISRSLTQALRGCRISEITVERLERVVDEIALHRHLVGAVQAWLRRDLERGARLRLYVEGVRHLLREPEFRQPEAATSVLQVLEEESVLEQALTAAPGERVWISIGSENRFAELRSCSLVLAAYSAGGQPGGTVGIVGPTRMRYSHAVSAVRYVAERLSEALRTFA